MDQGKIIIYMAIMIAVTNLIRIVPMLVIRRPITNNFVCSFLYYIPYVTLSLMTYPAIIEATGNPLAGYAALVVGTVAAWRGASLFIVSLLCCITVLIAGAL